MIKAIFQQNYRNQQWTIFDPLAIVYQSLVCTTLCKAPELGTLDCNKIYLSAPVPTLILLIHGTSCATEHFCGLAS